MSFTHNGVQHRRSPETEDRRLAQRIKEVTSNLIESYIVARLEVFDERLNLNGGSAWESNPPGTVSAPHTGFEVREPHQ